MPGLAVALGRIGASTQAETQPQAGTATGSRSQARSLLDCPTSMALWWHPDYGLKHTSEQLGELFFSKEKPL